MIIKKQGLEKFEAIKVKGTIPHSFLVQHMEELQHQLYAYSINRKSGNTYSIEYKNIF